MPSATEEAYLRAYSEERRGHAYLEFCREGDIDAIINMVKDTEEGDEDEDETGAGSADNDFLTYSGTFEGIEGSGLHVAIRYGREDVAWLLLALASALEWSKFPPAVLQAMESLGLSKEDRVAGVEIRSVNDSDGQSPKQLAEKLGGAWRQWIEAGRL